MKNRNSLVTSLASLLLLSSCAAGRHAQVDTKLHTVTLIDRNGVAETVSNPERIKQYQAVNFMAPQAYDKVYRIHRRDRSGNIVSYLHSYHENGQPKQYLEVINSRAQGLYKEWHPGGAERLEGNIIGGEADLSDAGKKSWIFDGPSFAWDDEGRALAVIYYEKGLLKGDSIYYHPNGAIWKKIPYSNNLINGTIEVFLDDGRLFQKIDYCGGMLNGSSFRYWPNCRLAAEEHYEMDLLQTGRYYDHTGNIVSEVNEGNGLKAIFGKECLAELHEYQNGFQEGEIKIFGTDKKLLKRYHIKNNMKHGEETEYYEVPHLRHVPKIMISWYGGKIQGIVKTWYDNGVQESNREMSNNKKNGVSTAWYRNGDLMLIEEYEQDKLVRGEYFRKGDKRPISLVKEGIGTTTIFDSDGNFIRKILYDNGAPVGTS